MSYGSQAITARSALSIVRTRPYPVGMTEFRHRASGRRKELGLTQQEVADQLGIEQSTLSGWEIGRREPETLQMFEFWAEVLQTHPAWLLYGIDPGTVGASTTAQRIEQLNVDDRNAVTRLIDSLSQ